MADEKPANVPVAVFGLDRERKPRAGVFPANQAIAATDRAKALSFVVRPVEGPTLMAAKGRLASLPPVRTPSSWKELEVGDLVLAEDPIPGDGWFEARLVEKIGADGFKVLFRDYPEEGEHLRRRDQLALLFPVLTPATKTAK